MPLYPTSSSVPRRSDSELESALDALGFNPLDGVLFRINPAFAPPPAELLERTRKLLADPTPGEALLADEHWEYDGRVERQVLEQLKALDKAKKKREEEEEKRIKEYLKRKEEDEKRAKEEEEDKKKKMEEEAKKKTEEAKKKTEEAKKKMEEAKMKMEEAKKKRMEEEERRRKQEKKAEVRVDEKSEVTTEPKSELLEAEKTSPDRPPSAPLGSFSPTQIGNISLKSPPNSIPPPLSSVPNAAPTQTNHISPSRPSQPINFSEFEGESDPFESLELKTINDIQELAAVLQSGPPQQQRQQHQHQQQHQQHHLHHQQQQQRMQQFRPQPHQPLQRYPLPQQQTTFQYPAYSPAFSAGFKQHPQMPSYFPQNVPYPGLRQQHQAASYTPGPYAFQQRPVTPQFHAVRDDSLSLKGSKSFGDIVSAVKREDGAGGAAGSAAPSAREGPVADRERRRRLLSSVTPPPRVGAGGGHSKGLDDWTPWPDLDSFKKKSTQVADPFAGLSNESDRILCGQLREMGFPVHRVVRACKHLGSQEGGERYIQFCLMADKLAEEFGKSVQEDDVERALEVIGADEDSCRKHLKAFSKLKDLGFESEAVHQALVEYKGDHDKALEKLLK